MAEHRCEKCSKIFDSDSALKMHNSAKHDEEAKTPFFTSEKKKAIKKWAIWILFISAFLAGVTFLISNAKSCETTPANEMNIGGHTNLLLHDHAELEILVSGERLQIPGDIGISGSIMRPIHTHDFSGELHIESPCAERKFNLGDFFDIWGQQFNEQCILDYCADGNKTLKMSVNGMPNNLFSDYALKDGDQIKIELS